MIRLYNVISEVIETRILKEITDSSQFALMLDESTVTEQLVIHGRYIDNATRELKSQSDGYRSRCTCHRIFI